MLKGREYTVTTAPDRANADYAVHSGRSTDDRPAAVVAAGDPGAPSGTTALTVRRPDRETVAYEASVADGDGYALTSVMGTTADKHLGYATSPERYEWRILDRDREQLAHVTPTGGGSAAGRGLEAVGVGDEGDSPGPGANVLPRQYAVLANDDRAGTVAGEWFGTDAFTVTVTGTIDSARVVLTALVIDLVGG